ncbi:MAG: Isoleucyl-tRNA synthetase, isoleucyl-tRNA synthetase [Candidatus Taylorbacteria bacterium]|nr:Isoleucyl-tRNA synthetase, isoleucyl-tRNA synthetase [Candidatus Taylorbacteria bacterium]
MSENPINPEKSPAALREEATLAFWNRENIFKQSIEKPAGLSEPRGDFVFYDGPPFANGVPHYGHLLAGTIKDAIPRYKTMRGYRVRRRWGWDCHGLPVENLIEKELGLKSKKDIVTYGIERFNEASRASVMRYADEWRKLVPRFGRFVDMDDDYKTMDCSYTESVWWAFKTLYDKSLIYEGFKVMQLCPRCETTLSNMEVAQGYKDIADLSVYAKFELSETPGTFILAWTTTPWTLPGNVALAVGPEIDYVKVAAASAPAVEGTEAAKSAETFIIAKSRLEYIKNISKSDLKIVEEMKGSALVGKSYKPVFDYYVHDITIKNRANAWKIYGADFVTTEDGTGVVHIAPAFGADDYELSIQADLPFIQHVSTDGKFKKEVTDFSGMEVKPKDGTILDAEGKPLKDAHQKADIEIIKYLAHHGSLFAKEKINHSYAHCWRCDTPLLNYATSSWFVKVPSFKDKLVAANKKVKWVPSEVGEGRFGNWLEGARDWAISRSRFWGAPLPVWKDEKTGEVEVVGSIADLKARSKARNAYFVMRHGEADNNAKSIISSIATASIHLTEKGKEQVRAAAHKLHAEKAKFDLVIVSPFLRTQETAAVIAASLKIHKNHIVTDERIHEINSGDFHGKSAEAYHAFFKGADRFTKKPKDGENFADVKRRMGDFLYDIDSKYEGKRILIVTHDTPGWLLAAAAAGLDEAQANALRGTTNFFTQNAEIRKLDFVPLPHNRDYELDLHRPYIDTVSLTSKAGNKLVRVPEVFDCWFESGSMPFAEAHYPFDKSEFDPNAGGFLAKLTGGKFGKSKGFPANFIAEGLDQTRGWFYSMLVLGIGLFGRSPYEQVIVNGLILAEDGQKMAKSKKNYPDPMDIVNKYGADAVRYYMLASPVVHGQDFCFAEKGVDEVAKKHIGRLNNVLTFYEMYADRKADAQSSVSNFNPDSAENLLDQWMLARLAELSAQVTAAMESYELDRATRPFADFIDDLSTWYLRRSRDRFKGDNTEGGGSAEAVADKAAALATTRYILMTAAKLLAPFMPFFAEEVYGRLKAEQYPKSVHLCAWPEVPAAKNPHIIALMAEVRRVSSLGLEARSKAKINVRQPLSTLTVKQAVPSVKESKTAASMLADIPGLVALILDEVNVKSLGWKTDLVGVADATAEVELDTAITPELKEEGNVRELIRGIQDLRKKADLTISDMVVLEMYTDASGKAIVEKHMDELKRITGLSSVDFVPAISANAETLSIGGILFAISIRR